MNNSTFGIAINFLYYLHNKEVYLQNHRQNSAETKHRNMLFVRVSYQEAVWGCCPIKTPTKSLICM